MTAIKRTASTDAKFFKSGRAFRTWLAKSGSTANELLVGVYKKGSAQGGMTYQDALDEALAFGWNAQAPWYQRTVAYWVLNAKKPETRARRLAILIERARKGERIPALAYPSHAKKSR